MDALTLFILATYVLQIIQVCFYSVPSAGSTAEMLVKVKNNPASACHHPAATASQSHFKIALLVGATILVTAISLIPLITIIYPPFFQFLIPLIAQPSDLMKWISIGCLVTGNLISYAAVATLKKNVSFHAFGETTRLYTSGLYGFLRNPITLGLALIYAGFFLALPSIIMLVGFIFFLLNSNYRIRMEEVYLERAFGDDYRQYKQAVGKYFPRVFGRLRKYIQ
jgi:protein-S-isoprenylcysteine O-methyltransferase Ste14